MVKYDARLTKIGNSYGIIIPKAFVKYGFFRERELVEITLVSKEFKKGLSEDGQIGIWSRDGHITGFFHSGISEPN